MTPAKLKKHLVKTQGHCGRAGAETIRIAKATGLSVHTIQSIAMKRKGMSASSKLLISAAIA